MTSWTDLEAAAPELAGRARAIFSSTTNCVLATLRADGSPRVSGIDPFFLEGELYVGSMPRSRKGADLARDPRMALHAIPWESRKVKEGATDPGVGDAKLTGRAVRLEDEAEVRRILEILFADLPHDTPEEGDLYRIDVESLVVVSVEDPELVIDRWTAAGGVQQVRRT